jgi:methionyl-tRNA formyltransferase
MNKDTQQNTNKHNVRRPAEKLLVISENQELCLFLKDELEKNLFEHPLKVDFCYTSFNLNPQQMIEIGAERINLKDEETINKIISDYDLVFSIHCKQIFPSRMVENVCCVNFHPGLNPYNRGWYPQVFSIINGLPVGATIHLMDSEVDHGEIIAQRSVDIKVSDTSLEIYRKIIETEKKLIHENVFDIVQGIFQTIMPEHDGNFNSLNDYKALCRLNLKSVATLGEHLNLLRATTHGNFKNAYFIDESNNKYFVRIVIEEEF